MTTHGMSDRSRGFHPLYSVWNSMLNRCKNERSPVYPRYGGRGISVCKTWETDFQTFYKWGIANGYKKGLHLDRTDNESGYDPGNCRFVTAKVNSRNRSNAIKIMYQGKAITLPELVERTSLGYFKLHHLYKTGKLKAFIAELEKPYDKT